LWSWELLKKVFKASGDKLLPEGLLRAGNCFLICILHGVLDSLGPFLNKAPLRSAVELLTESTSDDDEDETAELQRELEKIKRERAEKREQEVRTSFSIFFIFS
jgi:hypothetical protein